MKIHDLPLAGLMLIELDVYEDARGSFNEVWRRNLYERIGIKDEFVQDNFSVSHAGVLRGLHFQKLHPQGKLITVLSGTIFDVAVDLRKDSKTFGKWYSCQLNSSKGQQLWLPPGFAHGFYAYENNTMVSYKCTDYFYPEDQHTLFWADQELRIDWPTGITPILSSKDQKGKTFQEIRELFTV